jgi:hypothetical protein
VPPGSIQTLPGYVDIHIDIVNQALLGHIIILWPDEAQNQQIHLRPVKVLGKRMHNVHFHAPHRILVEGIPPDRHDHWVHLESSILCSRRCCRKVFGFLFLALLRLRRRRGWWRRIQARPAKVHARLDVGMPAYAEAGDGDVGGGDSQL